MSLGGLRGSKFPSEMIASHEIRDGKIKTSILRRFTTPTPVVAHNEILFVPLILLVGGNLHFKALCMWKKKKRPFENPQRQNYFHLSTSSAASTVHIPTSAQHSAPSVLQGSLLGQKRRHSLHSHSACTCCWTQAVTTGVRYRTVLQKPRSSSPAPAELPSCTNTTQNAAASLEVIPQQCHKAWLTPYPTRRLMDDAS